MIRETIPALEGTRLWCYCGQIFDAHALPRTCPECGYDIDTLKGEAERNTMVTAWLETKGLTWALPDLGESRLDWWARILKLYEEEHGHPA